VQPARLDGAVYVTPRAVKRALRDFAVLETDVASKGKGVEREIVRAEVGNDPNGPEVSEREH
jgi:hypothetical protein